MDTSEQCMTACKQSLKQNIFLLLSNSYLVFTLQVTSLGVNRRKTGREHRGAQTQYVLSLRFS